LPPKAFAAFSQAPCRHAVPPFTGFPMTHTPGSTSPTAPRTDQLNGTSLKWSSDGELSELDLLRILNLLSQADPVAEALMAHSLEPQD
jgi:hypothetical protein